MFDTIAIDNTRFIFDTNFSGDPQKDRKYGSTLRKANIVVPEELAMKLMDDGFAVRQTNMRPDDDPETFHPEYFVTVQLKYRTKTGQLVKYLPKVYLVNDEYEPRLLDENTVCELDNIRVKNVNVVLNPHIYNVETGEKNLYIRTMYVEQRTEDDPYAAHYRKLRDSMREGNVATA